MAILTTMTAPFLLKWTTDWLKRRGELITMNMREGVLILGVNPISLLLAKYLQDQTSVKLIDSNQDAVEQARKKGFSCIHGNALTEDVMHETGANSVQAFVAATANTEVNILAAQLAAESFQIPNTHVLLSKGKKVAGIDILKLSHTTSLFASGIDIDFWFTKISGKDFSEGTDIVSKKWQSRAWLIGKTSRSDNVLPLFVEDLSGNRRIFQFGDVIHSQEKVHFIKVEV